ncbi:unnamed protein product [Onchocerca ochengi]|uniref:Col_cuticle_N domain-containing protein n=1 Tax=Onchocerca ochengi TaxID=42157 RepID=A0A182EP30_ONCOC|nr:unnamed protein product [Onchocerca ochengi]
MLLHRIAGTLNETPDIQLQSSVVFALAVSMDIIANEFVTFLSRAQTNCRLPLSMYLLSTFLLIFCAVFLLQACGPLQTTGTRGPPGPPGRNGRDGSQGVRGEQGDVGEDGDEGDQGVPGVTGPEGEEGNIGKQGVEGDAGLVGIRGEHVTVG